MIIISRLSILLIAFVMVFSLLIPAQAEVIAETYTLRSKEIVQRAVEVIKPGQISYTSFYNIGKVEYADLKSAAAKITKLNGKLMINFDTLIDNKVVGRVIVNPLLVSDSSKTLYPIVYVSEDRKNISVKATFESLFDKPVEVMRLAQSSDFGMTVVVSGLLDISGLDADNLIAYSYNPDNHTYTRIKNAQCTLDEKGFVHLQTTHGGYIIITDTRTTE